MALTVLIDRFALDVLEDQVGLPALAYTGVEKPGDMGMGQPSEQVRLVSDLRDGEFTQPPALENLDGGLALEFLIAPTRRNGKCLVGASER